MVEREGAPCYRSRPRYVGSVSERDAGREGMGGGGGGRTSERKEVWGWSVEGREEGE